MSQTNHSYRAAHRARLRKRILLTIAVLATLLVLTFAVLLCADVARAIGDRNAHPGTSTDDPGGKEPSDDPGKDPVTPGDRTEEHAAADVHCGNLVLVNAANAYTFEEPDSRLVNIYNAQRSAKTLDQYYRLSGDKLLMESGAYQALDRMLKKFYEETGKHDVLIVSAYRSFEDQRASGSSVKPGYSDSHAGLSCALRVMPADGNIYPLTHSEIYAWITENCYKYGFVVRYPLDKVDRTGVDDYDYYFRYVGYAHAYIMKQNNLCLEEYIDLLHGYPMSGDPLSVTADNGVSYDIYYVPATGAVTTVPVPDESVGTYTVSGDNVGGFIVTVTKTAK